VDLRFRQGLKISDVNRSKYYHDSRYVDVGYESSGELQLGTFGWGLGMDIVTAKSGEPRLEYGILPFGALC